MTQVLNRRTLFATKWLQLEEVQYRDKKGKERFWTVASRPTTPADSVADCAGVLALVADPDKSDLDALSIVTVLQYRAPMGAKTLEFPAGLVESRHTDLGDVVRNELLEETGFHGEVLWISPPQALSPGMCQERMAMGVAYVDMGKPENRNPVQQQDEEEDIDIAIIPLKGLRKQLDRYKRDGVDIFDGLYMFAMGLEVGLALGQPEDFSAAKLRETLEKIFCSSDDQGDGEREDS